MKSFLKREWYFFIILIAPCVLAITMWDSIPAMVPIHWGINNQPDNFAQKEIGVFMGPGFNILLYFLFLIIPRIDSRWANYSLFKKSYKQIRLGIAVFGTLISIITMVAATGFDMNFGKVISYSLLALFALLGNLMGRVRQNFFLGIRTPWTLANEVVWQATHRLGGKFMFFGAILVAIVGFFIEDMTAFASVFIGYIIIVSLVPVLYSFVKYKQMERSGLIDTAVTTELNEDDH